MDADEKYKLISSAPTERLLMPADVKEALRIGMELKHCINFDITDEIHLGTGLVTASKIADLQKAGIKCNILLADLHALTSRKLGHDLSLIHNTAVPYYVEGLKKCVQIMGGKPGKLKFVLGSDLYNKHKSEFMKALLEISQNTAFKKIERDFGPKDSLSELLHIPMLVSDMFVQDCNFIHGGTDQKIAHSIARSVAPKLTQSALEVKRFFKTRKYKPIVLQQHVLLSLKKPRIKMSKSDPASAIFITDTESNAKGKLVRAYCPPSVKDNPVLDICKHIIFKGKNSVLEMTRPMRGGGQVHFYDYSDLEKVYYEGKIHTMDLKAAVAEKLPDILNQSRAHFEKGRNKKILEKFRKAREKRKIRHM